MKTKPMFGKAARLFPIAVISGLSEGALLPAYNVGSVISAPPEYESESILPITDGLAATGWTLTSDPASILIVGWDIPIIADGSGTLQVFTAPNVYPMASATGLTVRLLLEDGSYTAPLTNGYSGGHYPGSPGVQQVIFPAEMTVAVRSSFYLSDFYVGPLGIVGVEISEPRTSNGSDEARFTLVRAANVNVPDAVPELSPSLLLLMGGGVLAARRRRARP